MWKFTASILAATFAALMLLSNGTSIYAQQADRELLKPGDKPSG